MQRKQKRKMASTYQIIWANDFLCARGKPKKTETEDQETLSKLGLCWAWTAKTASALSVCLGMGGWIDFPLENWPSRVRVLNGS